MTQSTQLSEFETLRPRLLMLLELHRTAPNEAARLTLVDLFQDVFLSTAWHVAQDLLENGWSPGFSTPEPIEPTKPRGVLKLVGGTDAA
jgi:hypothetical protein